MMVLGGRIFWLYSLAGTVEENCRWKMHIFPSLAVMDDMGVNLDKEGEEMLIDPEKEAYYASDPKQALRKFFEREGKAKIGCDIFCTICLGYASFWLYAY